MSSFQQSVPQRGGMAAGRKTYGRGRSCTSARPNAMNGVNQRMGQVTGGWPSQSNNANITAKPAATAPAGAPAESSMATSAVPPQQPAVEAQQQPVAVQRNSGFVQQQPTTLPPKKVTFQEQPTTADLPSEATPFREQLWDSVIKQKHWDFAVLSDETLYPGYVFLMAKAIVVVESKYFETRFQKEPKLTELTIPNIPPALLKTVFEFMYRGFLTDYDIPGLHDAATFFEVANLLKRCPNIPLEQLATPANAAVDGPQQPSASAQTASQEAAQPAVGQPAVAKTGEGPITKQNLVAEIISSLISGDTKRQDEILSFIFNKPAEAESVIDSAEMVELSKSNPVGYSQVRGILTMKKP